MIQYVLVMLLWNVDTGYPDGYELKSEPVSAEECLKKLSDLPGEQPKNGNVKLYNCVPADLLKEAGI
jgi:hypothetical protein